LRRAEIIKPWRYLLRPFGEKELCITIEMALYANQLKKELDETTRRYRDILCFFQFGSSRMETR